MSVVAKFQVMGVEKNEYCSNVTLRPVYHENEPDHPNRQFWEATPDGQLDMTITNPAASDQFEVGQVYTLTFELETDKALGQFVLGEHALA